MSSSERFEYEEALRVLACLIFEIRVNWLEKVDEDPPGNIFDRLEAIIKYASPAAQPLVDHLRHNPPQERAGELYTYSFPFIAGKPRSGGNEGLDQLGTVYPSGRKEYSSRLFSC